MSAALAAALGRALGSEPMRARVLRAAPIELPLPPAVTPAGEGEGASATIATLDASSIESFAAGLGGAASTERLIVVAPVADQGLLGHVLSRTRRLRPVAIERVCTLLRHAGVVDLRVTQVPGALRLAIVTGSASAP